MQKTIRWIMSYLSETSEDNSPEEIKSKLNILLKGTELHALTKPIRDYRKAERGKIQSKNANLFHKFLLLIEVYTDVIDIIGENWHDSPTDEQKETGNKINAVSRLFNKSIQAMFDMLALLENGALVPTLGLWRIIYESYITSEYLLGKPDVISKQFNDHWQTTENRVIEKNKEKILEKKDFFNTNYSLAYGNNYGWAGDMKSTKDQHRRFNLIQFDSMQKREEEDKNFPNIYSFASTIVHSSSFTVNRPIFTDGEYLNTEMTGMLSGGMQLPIEWTIHIMQEFVMILLNGFQFVNSNEKESIVQISKGLASSILSELEKDKPPPVL